MNFSDFDYRIMKKVHFLALKGKGYVEPNPAVGAIIVKNNKIIGSGFHKIFGGNHAEIEALNSCKQSPKNSTIYINLEPCCFKGKTPPCTKALIEAGIKKVIISNTDPNKKINGKGIAELKKAGITVQKGLMENEGAILNQTFFKYIQSGLPFITLKAALSIDGKIYINSLQKYFSCQKSRELVHKLRSENQAILVGINTVIKDNPHLDVRNFKGKDPIRIILDNDLKIPLTSKVLRDAKTIIFTTKGGGRKTNILKKKGISIITLKKLKIIDILKKIGALGISNVLVEGGSKIFSSFIKENFVDKYLWRKK